MCGNPSSRSRTWRAATGRRGLGASQWSYPGSAGSREIVEQRLVSVYHDTVAIRLLQDVRQIFTDETIASADLVRRLVVLEDRPWADGTGGRPITQARVARLLRPFGINPMKLRFGTTTANVYTKRMFADSWSRYLPGPGR